jgi:Glycosyl hydrolase family 30 beta sandwich domain
LARCGAEIASHPHPFYTPVATFGSKYLLEPVAYGLKFAGSLSGGSFVKAELSSQLQAAGVDASAYAAKLPDGHVAVIVLNKDAEKDLNLTLDFGDGKTGRVAIETLHAPSLDSRKAAISRSGHAGQLEQGKYTVRVPHASGVRLALS